MDGNQNVFSWIFDGIGTEVIVLIGTAIIGFVGYKVLSKRSSTQKQKAKDEANQRQEMIYGNDANEKVKQKDRINQYQKAGNKATQVQIGRDTNGRK